MHHPLALLVTPLLSLFAAGAVAQAPVSLHLPWNAPPGQAVIQLEQDGFRRRAGNAAYLGSSSGAGARILAPDTSASVYARESGAVKESVFLRKRSGETVQMFYSAVGDSATLQAKIDAVRADAALQLGPGAPAGSFRVWQGADGRRLTLPSRPSRARDEYHLTILYSRP